MIKIKPSSNNTNRHTKQGMELLEKSIDKVGVIESISVADDGTIISGHARKEIFDKKGMVPVEIELNEGEYPVIKTQIKSESKEYYEAQILANTTANKNFNLDYVLIEELSEIHDIDIADVGVDIEDDGSGNKNVKEDDYDCTPKENIITNVGDIYEIGDHRLLCGDSTQTDTFEKLMQGEFADMCVTDPPYNVALGMETKEQAKARNRRTDGLIIQNDKMSNDDFYKFLYDFYSALSTAVKKGGAIYVWYASSEVVNFVSAMVDAGWLYKQELIWNKTSMIMGRQDYQWKHEPCLYGWLDGASHNWNSDRKQTTIIDFDKPQRNGEHPTMKPIGLFGYQIENSSKVGDIVIDAFGGSGTTMVACEQIKRKARVIEFDPKYCDVIVKRMIKLDNTLTVKRNGVDVTNEWL